MQDGGSIGYSLQSRITAFSSSSYERYHSYDNLVSEFHRYSSYCDDLPDEDLDLFALAIKRMKNATRTGGIIDPREAILQRRDFVEISPKRIQRKFNKSGRLRKSKFVNVSDLTRIETKYPLSEDHERGARHGGARFSGTLAQTEDWDGSLEDGGTGAIVEFKYSVRSCHSVLCSVCGEKAILDRAWNLSERIWSGTGQYVYLNAGRCHVYEVVFSPPQGSPRELKEAIDQSDYREGLDEWRQAINHAIRTATAEAGGLVGWTTIYHAVRGNGKKVARKYNDWDGNDGDPNHYRRAPHFHVILSSPLTAGQLIRGFNKAREDDLKGWIIGVGYNQREREKADRQGTIYKPHEIETRFELEDKLAYLLSHQGITCNADGTGQQDDLWDSHGLNHGSQISEICIKKRLPLLRQGYVKYVEIDGERKPLFWSKLLYMCLSQGLDTDLAHVEGINSSRVYAHKSDKAECRAIVQEFVKENPGDLEGLYLLIRYDRRFLHDFIPKDGCPLREPNRLYAVEGGDLHFILEGGDTYDEDREYREFCQERDRAEAELMAELRDHLNRYKRGG